MSSLEPSADATTQGEPVAPVHDFVRKLQQRGLRGRVVDYVQWARNREDPMPAWAPLSINLDLTTACNYACDHCIDFDILNSGINHDDAELRASLAGMAERGLKSVILIGGGEPTVYPKFREIVRFLKALELQVAIVSNGSRNDRIHEVIDCLDENDWIRLSLDSGTDATFQAMHKPKLPITLEDICAWAPRWRKANQKPRIGFSFIITWTGALRAPDTPAIVENIEEMAQAARLAHDHGFDYISFKPFLIRAEDGAEVLDPERARVELEGLVGRIRAQLDQARTLQSDRFAVVESTNLRVLAEGSWRDWTNQPRTCHMQALRQVLSPQGLWNCPAHRGVPHARIDDRTAFGDASTARRAADQTQACLDRFDASQACREVTCLYHDVNWWIERAIADPSLLDAAPAIEGEDYFL